MFLSAAAVQAQDTQIHEPGNGVTLPEVVSKVNPDYTAEAKAARIQGTVGLRLVVQRDGTVDQVEVEQSLDSTLGLDQAAVAAMKQWRFKPGTKDKKAVAVRITVRMTFALR